MNIEDNSIYKSAETKQASDIMLTEPKFPDESAIVAFFDNAAKSVPSASIGYALGKLYKNNIRGDSSATDILLILFEAYSEVLQRELQYNNDRSKVEVIKNSLNVIQNTLKNLKLLSYESNKDNMIYLLRSLVI
jgi:hypothetical protein